MRPLVAKHLAQFERYVKEYGSDTVKRVLEDGRCGKVKLTCPLGPKDRREMVRALGLDDGSRAIRVLKTGRPDGDMELQGEWLAVRGVRLAHVETGPLPDAPGWLKRAWEVDHA